MNNKYFATLSSTVELVVRTTKTVIGNYCTHSKLQKYFVHTIRVH